MPESNPGVKFTPLPGAQDIVPDGAFEEAGAEDPRKLLNGAATALQGGSAAPTAEEEERPELPSGPEIVEEDKKAYMRSMLAGERFKKTYCLFGGEHKVTLQTRLVGENEHISYVLDSAVSFTYPGQKDLWRQRVKLLHSTNATAGKELNGLDAYKTLFNEVYGSKTDVIYAAECATFNDFELLCDAIFARANDPDFWSGIAGRS